jgi:hypothetical protein
VEARQVHGRRALRQDPRRGRPRPDRLARRGRRTSRATTSPSGSRPRAAPGRSGCGRTAGRTPSSSGSSATTATTRRSRWLRSSNSGSVRGSRTASSSPRPRNSPSPPTSPTSGPTCATCAGGCGPRAPRSTTSSRSTPRRSAACWGFAPSRRLSCSTKRSR